MPKVSVTIHGKGSATTNVVCMSDRTGELLLKKAIRNLEGDIVGLRTPGVSVAPTHLGSCLWSCS